MQNILMQCGHIANSQRARDNAPYCAICCCDKVVAKGVEFKGRLARCSDCGDIKESSPDLPFFKARPECEYDSFYCGCWGWD